MTDHETALYADVDALSATDGWTIESAAEIHLAGVPAAQFDIDKLQESEGLLHIFGPPGSLKSWLMMHAGECMVTGKPFLGHYAVRQRPYVVYVNLDAGSNAFRRRVLKAIGRHDKFKVINATAFDVSEFRRILAMFRGAYVIVDCFADMYEGARRGEDQGEVMRHFVRKLRALYEEFGCNGAIVDHPRRSSDGQPPEYYGSIQKEATFRAMWMVAPIKTDDPRLKKAKITCRKMNEEEHFAPFVASVRFANDRVTFAFEATLDEGTGLIAAGPTDSEVAENLLRDVAGGMSSSSIGSRLGWGKNRVLAAMVTRNIHSVGRGPKTRYVHRNMWPALDGSSLRSDDRTDDSPEMAESALSVSSRSSLPLREEDDTIRFSGTIPQNGSSLENDDSGDDSLNIDDVWPVSGGGSHT
jgi:hypothetical protein